VFFEDSSAKMANHDDLLSNAGSIGVFIGRFP